MTSLRDFDRTNSQYIMIDYDVIMMSLWRHPVPLTGPTTTSIADLGVWDMCRNIGMSFSITSGCVSGPARMN
jgi:hypothetical protein